MDDMIAGRTLAEWKEFARRDDCLHCMVPSDLRLILSAIPAADAWAEALKEAARVAGDAAVAILLQSQPDASPLRQQLARQSVAVPILALAAITDV